MKLFDLIAAHRSGYFACLGLMGLLSVIGCAVSDAQDPAALKSPTSYDECVAQNGKILRTFPGQCVSASGEHFVDPQQAGHRDPSVVVGAVKKMCVDMCGDGKCQEMVCLGEGCPCAESAQSCPKDCQGAQ